MINVSLNTIGDDTYMLMVDFLSPWGIYVSELGIEMYMALKDALVDIKWGTINGCRIYLNN